MRWRYVSRRIRILLGTVICRGGREAGLAGLVGAELLYMTAAVTGAQFLGSLEPGESFRAVPNRGKTAEPLYLSTDQELESRFLGKKCLLPVDSLHPRIIH